MPVQRTYGEYGDGCRAANALDVVGDRWTLLIVRETILGPKRFVDLQALIRGITPAVLTERMRRLQVAGVLERVTLPGPGRTTAYVATDWGRGLEPVLQALGRWYTAGPDPSTSGGMTPDAAVIAMRTMAPRGGPGIGPLALDLYDARLTHPVSYRYGVLSDGTELIIEAGSPQDPVVTVTADATAWCKVIFDGRSIEDAETDGVLAIEGDRRAVRRLVAAYS